MRSILVAIVASLSALLRSRASVQMEILVFQHQLAVLQQSGRRPRLTPSDRLLWSWISRHWAGWKDALVIVKPETVIAWRRRKFREHWTKLTRAGKPGRPLVPKEIRDLIRRLSSANPLWGTPRILGELAKIGIDVSQSTIDKYRVRHRKTPSPGWRAFLANHASDLVSIDFFIVPTTRFRVLFVFLILATDRRRVLHFNVTTNPTSEWTARQITQAFPWDTAPAYLLRDRDRIYGSGFRNSVRNLGIEEVMISPRSPWQNPYVERLIGSIRRECIDHMVVFSEEHLRKILRRYFRYYHRSRTHLALEMDSPESRPVEPVDLGDVVQLPEVGGLHHRYERWAA